MLPSTAELAVKTMTRSGRIEDAVTWFRVLQIERLVTTTEIKSLFPKCSVLFRSSMMSEKNETDSLSNLDDKFHQLLLTVIAKRQNNRVVSLTYFAGDQTAEVNDYKKCVHFFALKNVCMCVCVCVCVCLKTGLKNLSR